MTDQNRDKDLKIVKISTNVDDIGDELFKILSVEKRDFSDDIEAWNEKYGKYLEYNVLHRNIEMSLLASYQRCDTPSLKKFLFSHVICNSEFIWNPEYTYSLEHSGSKLGQVSSNKKGIYFLQIILKYDNLFKLFVDIMDSQINIPDHDDVESAILKAVVDRKENVDQFELSNKFLVISDHSNRIPLEYLVFGSYNQLYQSIKFGEKSNDSNRLLQHKRLMNWLHYFQQRTNFLKFQQIS